MNIEDVSNLISEKGPRGALKHCIESGEHRKGTAYQVGRFVGLALVMVGIAGGIALLLAGIGSCLGGV